MNPVPVSVVRGMGADFIIAVNVMPDMRERALQARRKEMRKLKRPDIFNVIMQSMQIASCLLVRSCLEGADIVIAPRVEHIGRTEFQKAQECILTG